MAATIVSTHERATAAERILRAAVVLFRERGYHGSSMRTLARALRMEAASLYYHFKSKQEILFAILDRTLDDLLAGVGRAVASADGPEARLRVAVRFHVLFHTDSQHEAFLSHSELRWCSRGATSTSACFAACWPRACAPACSRCRTSA
jgi:TetR/AcrR family transcriptional regulator, cholesterol catabolism regulator